MLLGYRLVLSSRPLIHQDSDQTNGNQRTTGLPSRIVQYNFSGVAHVTTICPKAIVYGHFILQLKHTFSCRGARYMRAWHFLDTGSQLKLLGKTLRLWHNMAYHSVQVRKFFICYKQLLWLLRQCCVYLLSWLLSVQLKCNINAHTN